MRTLVPLVIQPRCLGLNVEVPTTRPVTMAIELSLLGSPHPVAACTCPDLELFECLSIHLARFSRPWLQFTLSVYHKQSPFSSYVSQTST